MMFKSAVLASLMASVAATSFVPNGDIAADSPAGQKLMSKARALEQEGDMTWMANYNIKYLGCSSLLQVNPEGGEEEGILYTQNLVKFALCSASESCSSCGTGAAQYVVPMNEFIDAWTEAQMQAEERACEQVRENCYCENANDDQACETQCFQQMGMDQCIEYEEEGDAFEVQRYLECEELEAANDNNNGNYNYNYNNNNNGVNMYQQYYVGPTCSDGVSINLAVFNDAGCTSKASSGVYEAFNYGSSLPYSSESLVTKSACMSCKQVNEDENNNNNNNNNGYYYEEQYEVAEICEQTYERAAKCESSLNAGSYFYPDTSGCDYINTILPKLAKVTSGVSFSTSASTPSGSTFAVSAAVIFFLTTIIFGAYSFFLYRKIHRAKVNLAQSEGMTMA